MLQMKIIFFRENFIDAKLQERRAISTSLNPKNSDIKQLQ